MAILMLIALINLGLVLVVDVICVVISLLKGVE